jgi:DNA (cytosine-5)-methyltransferase 1
VNLIGATKDDRPVVVDGFSCQSGASAGFERAGFRTIGIEINPKMAKRSPFEVVVGDVLEVFPELVARYNPVAVGGSPPCQRWTDAQVIQNNEHPDLITPFRELVQPLGLPYWIENVRGAVRAGALRPDVRLCGLMFGLETDRHRYFETSFPVQAPPHPVGPRGLEDHRDMPKTKMGRPFVAGQLRQYVGNFHGVALAREDLGVPWMNRDGVRECIPPAYGEHIGRQLALHLARERARERVPEAAVPSRP